MSSLTDMRDIQEPTIIIIIIIIIFMHLYDLLFVKLVLIIFRLSLNY